MKKNIVLKKKTLQIKYLKKLLRMSSLLVLVFVFGNTAFYMGDFELSVILFFLYIYFFMGTVKHIKENHLKSLVNTFLVQNLINVDGSL